MVSSRIADPVEAVSSQRVSNRVKRTQSAKGTATTVTVSRFAATTAIAEDVNNIPAESPPVHVSTRAKKSSNPKSEPAAFVPSAHPVTTSVPIDSEVFTGDSTGKVAANAQAVSSTTTKQASSQGQSSTSSKAAASLASASKRLQSTNSLSDLRIGETKKVLLRPSIDVNAQLSFLRPGCDPEPLTACITAVTPSTDGAAAVPMTFDDFEIQGILQKFAMSYSITIITKVTNDSLHFDMALYGQKKLILSCRDIEIMNQVVEIKPSLSVLPFKSYTFHNATNDSRISQPGKVLFTMLGQPTKEVAFTGQEIAFPTDFPDGMVTITQEIVGFASKPVKHVLYKRDMNEECSRVFLSPKDLGDDEWRVVLK